MLFAFFVLLRSYVGLGVKLAELVFGERDYSSMIILCAAEEPNAKLLLQLVLSALVFGLAIIAGTLEEEKR
jgi:hypothetical protein